VATYIQGQSLLALLPELAKEEEARERLLSLLAQVTQKTVAHFFSHLRARCCDFPSELPQHLGDIFGGALDQLVRNAVTVLDCEQETHCEAEEACAMVDDDG
jgi:hypothetical protein